MTAIVIGASGGIGGAMMRAIPGPVIGLSRSSDPPIDLLDEDSIARAAAQMPPPSLVLVATGALHAPEKSFRALDPTAMARAFAINAIGPALVAKHFLPLLPKRGRSVFAVLSAKVGSIGDNHLGGWYSYRAAKAALNQILHTAAIELRRTHPDAICVALHPGTVDTPLSQGFAKTGLEVQTPDAAAARLLALIDGLGPEHSGQFLDRGGQILPW